MSLLRPLIGLYGGSFDPVHLGHIALAEALRDRFHFQEIRFLPAARNPLKGDASDNRHRLAMLELALNGKQALTIDTRELHRPPPSYTIDTLRELRHELGDDASLVFIMGQDSYNDLPRWKDWQQLTHYAHLLVVNRPDNPPVAPHAGMPLPHSPHSLLNLQPSGMVWQVELPPHAIASRDIRRAIRGQNCVNNWLNPAVSRYIEQHHLYHGHTCLE